MYKISKKIKIIIIVLIIIIVGVGYYFYENTKDSEYVSINDEFLEKKDNEISENKNEKEIIIIHIDGCVENPGIIKLEEGSRISDAVEKAGGLTTEADISRINLASILEDGIKIHIPSNTENKGDDNMEENNYTVQKESKININTASQEVLQTLPGIGDNTAQKIISYRKENGKFSNIEDIKNVKGIGQSKFETIKDLITIK